MDLFTIRSFVIQQHRSALIIIHHHQFSFTFMPRVHFVVIFIDVHMLIHFPRFCAILLFPSIRMSFDRFGDRRTTGGSQAGRWVDRIFLKKCYDFVDFHVSGSLKSAREDFWIPAGRGSGACFSYLLCHFGGSVWRPCSRQAGIK